VTLLQRQQKAKEVQNKAIIAPKGEYDCKPLFPHSGINFLQVFFEQKLLPNFYVLFC